MIRKRDITVTNNHNGIIDLMAMNGDHLFRRRYIDYTVREAKALFIADAIREQS